MHAHQSKYFKELESGDK
jgi:hypothetical protein